MKEEKKLMTLKVNSELYDLFQIATIINKTTMTKVIEEHIRNYIITNKINMNEYIKGNEPSKNN